MVETEEVINEKQSIDLYEPGEVPPLWREATKNIRVLQLAMTFGLVIPEYTMKDYIQYAVESKNGFETIDVWGVQGSMKSNRTLQISHWIYGNNDEKSDYGWDTVLKELVLVPDAHDLPGYEERGFLQKMKEISKGECAPLVAWDDITVGMPNSTFKTDIEQYGAVDSAWAAIRTKIKVMVLNNPLIDRLGRNIKDNITLECFIGRNQTEMVERCIHIPGLKHLESNFFKIQVEPLHKFDWRNVPRDVFKQYHDLRFEIADLAIQKMGKAFEGKESLEGEFVSPIEIMDAISISPDSLSDKLKRNFIPNKKVNGRIFVSKQDFEDFKRCYLKNPRAYDRVKKAKENE